MLIRWLGVCLLALLASGELAAQQAIEPAFDPKPVTLPQSDSASPRPVTSKDLLSIREIHGLSISPDGQRIAFVVGQADFKTNSYRSGLFIVRRQGGTPAVCLGSAGEPHWSSINEWASEQPKWARNSRTIFYRMRMKKEERWQVWQWGKEPRGAKPLTHVPGDVVRYELDPTGRKLIMDVEFPIGREVEKGILERGILYDKQILPWEGMPALTTNLASAKIKNEIWIHELNTGVERKATPAEKHAFEPDVTDFQKKFDSKLGTTEPKCHIGSVEWAPTRKNALAFVLL